MASSTRTITKALAAEEDLLYGEGVVQQTRAGVPYNVTKIRGFRPVNDVSELNLLDSVKFPKAVLVDNGLLSFYQFNGTEYEQLVPVTKSNVITDTSSTVIAAASQTLLFSVGSVHTISSITGGTKGQVLHIVSTTSFTTIQSNAGIVLKGG